MRRYLLVDDNRELAENLAEMPRERGAELQVAQGGAEALDRVRHGRFDAVVTDMRMPAMGGAVLVRQLRRLDPGLAAPPPSRGVFRKPFDTVALLEAAGLLHRERTAAA